MTDKDKNLKVFLQENTKAELKKPVNEFSEILSKVEKEPRNLFRIPKWFYATAGVVAISLFAAYFSTTTSVHTNDEQLMSFLADSLDESSLYEDDTEEASLLSLIN